MRKEPTCMVSVLCPVHQGGQLCPCDLLGILILRKLLEKENVPWAMIVLKIWVGLRISFSLPSIS